MSKSKTFGITIKAEKQTDPIKEVVHEFSDLVSILRLVNLPFRLYHMALRLSNVLQAAFNAETAASVPALAAQNTAVGAYVAELAATNAMLKEYIMLQAIATGGASLPAAAAAAGAAASLLGLASAAPVLQTGGLITRTGAAIVERGERVIPAGGGMGDVNISIANVSLDPEGLDLTDFTNRLGEQLRLGLRGHTRDIPS